MNEIGELLGLGVIFIGILIIYIPVYYIYLKDEKKRGKNDKK